MIFDNNGVSYDGKRIMPYNKTRKLLFDFTNNISKKAMEVYRVVDNDLDRKFLLALEIIDDRSR